MSLSNRWMIGPKDSKDGSFWLNVACIVNSSTPVHMIEWNYYSEVEVVDREIADVSDSIRTAILGGWSCERLEVSLSRNK